MIYDMIYDVIYDGHERWRLSIAQRYDYFGIALPIPNILYLAGFDYSRLAAWMRRICVLWVT